MIKIQSASYLVCVQEKPSCRHQTASTQLCQIAVNVVSTRLSKPIRTLRWVHRFGRQEVTQVCQKCYDNSQDRRRGSTVSDKWINIVFHSSQHRLRRGLSNGFLTVGKRWGRLHHILVRIWSRFRRHSHLDQERCGPQEIHCHPNASRQIRR